MLDLANHSILVTKREDIMDVVRDGLYNADLVLIANRVGVGVSTLYAIRAGRTKWPRHATLLTLLDVLKIDLWISRR